MRQTALLIEPEVAPLPKVIEGMLAEEVAVTRVPRAFVRDRFCSILAEFEKMPVVDRTRPRAALANEAVFLIRLQQRLYSARRTHLAHGKTCHLVDRRQARLTLGTRKYSARIRFQLFPVPVPGSPDRDRHDPRAASSACRR